MVALDETGRTPMASQERGICQSRGASRRDLLCGLGATAAAVVLPGCAARSQATAPLIDTHHHFYPPEYQKAWLAWEDVHKVPHPAPQLAWSRQRMVELLDQNNIRTAMLSVASTPGVWFDAG